MKNNVVYLSAIALGLFAASCSDKNQPMPEPVDESGAVSFRAAVPKAPRSASTTTSTIKEFIVYAYTGGKPYMQDVHVTRNGSSWVYSPVMYWPNTPVNFYAFSPNITNVPATAQPELGSIPGYKNNGTTDLLYAVNMGEVAKATPVSMNFRHALSRVTIMLSSSNSKIGVRVSYVKLHNVYLQGTFNFPQATTSPDFPDNVGNWDNLKMSNDMMVFAVIGDEDIFDLTPTPVDITDNNLGISYFLPQPLTQLDFDGTAYSSNGIEVDCEIYDTATGAKIWPNAATPPAQLVPESPTGRLFFPVTTDAVDKWEMGHEYIYNITIDNPDVLKPIIFDVTVDDFLLEQ